MTPRVIAATVVAEEKAIVGHRTCLVSDEMENSPMHKVVFTDYYYPGVERERAILSEVPDIEIVDLQVERGGVKDPKALIPLLRDADAVITQYARLDAEVIDAMQHCKILTRYGIGVDTIDVKHAKERGIAVANVPDYCIEEVSDSAMAHLLNAVRRIGTADRALRRNRFSYEIMGPIRRLSTLTVGLLAFGNIARRTAEKLRPWGCRIQYFDPWFADRDGRYAWAHPVSFDEMVETSDIISVHAPLTEDTRDMLDARALARMKKDSILVCTSRGGIINENALCDALASGHLAYAGLDVLERDDADYINSRLLELEDRVSLTPHMGWAGVEALEELREKVARNVASTLMTGKPVYPL